jgi:uncharacterized membrane protein
MTDTPTPAPQPAPEGAATAAPVTLTLDARTMAIAVYALYLAALLSFGLAGVAGVIIAYVVRKDAPEWLQSHFTFQIRSFWIWLAASVVGGLLTFIGVGVLIVIAAALWFLVRSVAGLGQVLNSKPYPKPESWMI